MSFGQIIKKLRRNADMTQEQLAELLSISPQAISRWETGAAMPDISLLPALVNIFNVTSDELLGINSEKKNAKVTEILELADQAMERREYKKAAEILREGYHQYPRSFPIMENLAHALLYVYSRQGEKNYDDVIYLCNNILTSCTDNTIRYNTLCILGTVYTFTGQKEEMMSVVDQMPPFLYSREIFLLERICDTDAGLVERQKFLNSLVEKILLLMKLLPLHRHDDGSAVFLDDERIKIWEQVIKIVEVIYPDGDCQRATFFAGEACGNLARIYLNRGDTESGIYWFERSCEFFVYHDTPEHEEKQTSPAFRGCGCEVLISTEKTALCADRVKEYLTESVFDKIRNDPRFEAGIKRLQQVVDEG